MTPCECGDCDYPCDQYQESGSSNCYDCDNDEHMQDRDG